MTHPNPSTALAFAVVDQLVADGVETIVISPGSRSAALAIAAATHDDIRTVVAIDERSAGFHALGVARASGAPAAVISTSGTAPANYFPAVVEADMACVPLVVVSADRPAEMQGVGANQTIDQIELFGRKVRDFAAIEAPSVGSIGDNDRWRSVVSRLMSKAMGPRPGPVHLNVAFREPTVPVSDDGRTAARPYDFPTPRLELESRPTSNPIPQVPQLTAERGVVLAGDGEYDRDALVARASELGWPVLATALSGLRGRGVISCYEHLLSGGLSDDLRPDTVVAVGALGPGTSLDRLIAGSSRRVRADAWGRPIDPQRNATDVFVGDPNLILESVSGAARPEWATKWLEAAEKMRTRLDAVLDGTEQPSGAGVARAMNEVDWGALVVSSSLPIREVDAHLDRGGRVFANRGASGIDGFVSSAIGVSSVIPRTLALCGDLSLLHDANGFLVDDLPDITIVVIDNGGGGLFDSLPQARHAPQYERLFVSDPERDLSRLAGFHGADFELAEDVEAVIGAAARGLSRSGVTVVAVPVDRQFDLEVRSRLRGALKH